MEWDKRSKGQMSTWLLLVRKQKQRKGKGKHRDKG